ncbi:hypothetical protein IQ07DRAFT_602972 [Pyrenochaeta sp. DS3sAY3a]|nr:hypothetical protein IQ07DRAFT_602972 [Pyrenochaeta sp. DS3sAY3a]
MLKYLFFSAGPFCAHALYFQEAQQPLLNAAPRIPLQMDENRQWAFRTDQNSDKVFPLQTLQDASRHRSSHLAHHTVSIHIPLDQSHPASIEFTMHPTNAQDPLSAFSDTLWVKSKHLGRGIRILEAGIRKGGMVSMPAFTAQLALDTPFIFIPTELYNIVLQATAASPSLLPYGDMYVDCPSLPRFPDIVLGLEPDAEEAGSDASGGVDEIVVTPEQYIMEVESGKCVLLVREMERRKVSEGIVLGWAALRGSEVVLDWERERLGFAKTNL